MKTITERPLTINTIMIQATKTIETYISVFGLDKVVKETSFIVMLMQNTDKELLAEEIESDLPDYEVFHVAREIGKGIMFGHEKYEELFHKGWDFKEIVEDVMVEKNLHF